MSKPTVKQLQAEITRLENLLAAAKHQLIIQSNKCAEKEDINDPDGPRIIYLRKPGRYDYLEIVLARYGGQYVTWICNKSRGKGYYTNGDYYGNDLNQALEGFLER